MSDRSHQWQDFGLAFARREYVDVPVEDQPAYALDLDCAQGHHAVLRLAPGEEPAAEAFFCVACRGPMGVGGAWRLEPEEGGHLPCPACARGLPCAARHHPPRRGWRERGICRAASWIRRRIIWRLAGWPTWWTCWLCETTIYRRKRRRQPLLPHGCPRCGFREGTVTIKEP